jgi:hypothetical protein
LVSGVVVTVYGNTGTSIYTYAIADPQDCAAVSDRNGDGRADLVVGQYGQAHL